MKSFGKWLETIEPSTIIRQGEHEKTQKPAFTSSISQPEQIKISSLTSYLEELPKEYHKITSLFRNDYAVIRDTLKDLGFDLEKNYKQNDPEYWIVSELNHLRELILKHPCKEKEIVGIEGSIGDFASTLSFIKDRLNTYKLRKFT